MAASIQEAIQKALERASEKHVKAATPPSAPPSTTPVIPPEWDDEPTAVQTNQTQPQPQPQTQPQTQPQEKTMQTAQEKPMSAKKAQYFKPTTNVTRATFAHIKNNPGLNRAQVIKQLEPQGYQMTSTSSIIAQFIRMGYVRRTDDGALFALINEYKPVKTAVLKQSRAKEAKQIKALVSAAKKKVHLTNGALPKQERKRVVVSVIGEDKNQRIVDSSGGLASLQPVKPVQDGFDAQRFVDSMTLGQARQVYDVLRKVFGG